MKLSSSLCTSHITTLQPFGMLAISTRSCLCFILTPDLSSPTVLSLHLSPTPGFCVHSFGVPMNLSAQSQLRASLPQIATPCFSALFPKSEDLTDSSALLWALSLAGGCLWARDPEAGGSTLYSSVTYLWPEGLGYRTFQQELSREQLLRLPCPRYMLFCNQLKHTWLPGFPSSSSLKYNASSVDLTKVNC